jgi:hypothetical protein
MTEKYDKVAIKMAKNQIGMIVLFLEPTPNSRKVPFLLNRKLGFRYIINI